MSMPLLTILAGLGLTVLGVGTYVATGSSHPTALIPAGLGVVQVLLGIVASKDNLRKHAMHGAATISLVGLIGGVAMGAPRWVQYLQEGKVTRPDGSDASMSALAMLVVAVICLVHLALCVNSFIQARRNASKN
jgi:uncharacterized membrane protein YidH (DUF202 family)